MMMWLMMIIRMMIMVTMFCFFCFIKGLLGVGQIRGRGTEEFQSEVQRSFEGELEDEGQLDDALLGQR